MKKNISDEKVIEIYKNYCGTNGNSYDVVITVSGHNKIRGILYSNGRMITASTGKDKNTFYDKQELLKSMKILGDMTYVSFV